MTAQQIKEAYRAGNGHWEILAMIYKGGSGYQAAVGQVSRALQLDDDQRAEMEYGYENNC